MYLRCLKKISNFDFNLARSLSTTKCAFCLAFKGQRTTFGVYLTLVNSLGYGSHFDNFGIFTTPYNVCSI